MMLGLHNIGPHIIDIDCISSSFFNVDTSYADLIQNLKILVADANQMTVFQNVEHSC